MMDPITGLALRGLSSTAQGAIKMLRAHCDKPTERLLDARRIDWESKQAEAIHIVIPELVAVCDDLDRRVTEMAKDEELVFVWQNFEWEGRREATGERRKMLAYASAAMLEPEIPSAQKARIERLLRSLGPTDAAALAAVRRCIGRTNHTTGRKTFTCLAELRYDYLQKLGADGENLEGLGLVKVDLDAFKGAGGVGNAKLRITATGKMLLHILRHYLATRRLEGVPGRDPAMATRTEDEALSVFQTEYPTLFVLLLRLARRGLYHTLHDQPGGGYILQLAITDASNWHGAFAAESRDAGELQLVVSEPTSAGGGSPYFFVQLSGAVDLILAAHDIVVSEWDDSPAHPIVGR